MDRHRRLVFLRQGCLALPLFLMAGVLFFLSAPAARSAEFMKQVMLGASRPLYLPVILKSMPETWVDRLLISEVCYDPLGSEPDGEWIEIFNAGSNSIDLSKYKIGDAANLGDREGMLTFPAGTVIKPGEVLVIANRGSLFYENYGWYPDFEMNDSLASVPDMDRYLAWANRSVELTNSGDEVLVLGPEDQLIDAVSWGTSVFAFKPSVSKSMDGGSIERYPALQDTDTASDWRTIPGPNPGKVDLIPPTPTPTRTLTPSLTPTATFTPVPSSTLSLATPSPGLTASLKPTKTPIPTVFSLALLISEVLYDPYGIEPQGEWIEIYNPSSERIWLRGFKVGDEEERGGNEGMMSFPASAYIDPGQVIVIANQAVTFYNIYQFKPDYEMMDTDIAVPNLEKYLPWSSGNINLANTSPHDEVLILDAADNLVDAVSWGSSKWAFSPSALTTREGESLERYPPHIDTDSAFDWRTQAEPNPGKVTVPLPTATPTHTPTETLLPTATFTPVHTATAIHTAVLIINEIHANPAMVGGDANGDGSIDNSDDEFVEIINSSGQAISLSNWKLSDDLEVRHIFPEGTWLEDGCAIVVFGGGTPQGDFGGSLVQVAVSGKLFLDNFGDSVVISSPDGSSIFSYTYNQEGGHGQSITRYPDISGADPLIFHSTAPGSGGALFSPGTQIDGTAFTGCGEGVPGREPESSQGWLGGFGLLAAVATFVRVGRKFTSCRTPISKAAE